MKGCIDVWRHYVLPRDKSFRVGIPNCEWFNWISQLNVGTGQKIDCMTGQTYHAFLESFIRLIAAINIHLVFLFNTESVSEMSRILDAICERASLIANWRFYFFVTMHNHMRTHFLGLLSLFANNIIWDFPVETDVLMYVTHVFLNSLNTSYT